MHLLKDILLKSFQEHTLMWFFLSNIVAGIIGASFKILFENLLPYKLSSYRQTNDDFLEFCHKLLLAAKYTDNRVDFIIKNKSSDFQFDNENSKISFYYSICQYFCWMRILSENALNKFIKRPKRYKKFIILFFDTHKSLCSAFHFKDLSTLDNLYNEGGIIPAYEINSIVDLMMSNIVDNKTIIKSPVITQSEFIFKYKNDEAFRNYFITFENWLNKLEPNQENLSWNRMLIFSYHIKMIIKFLDSKNHTTYKVNSLPYKNLFHKIVYENVLKDQKSYKKNKIKIKIDLV